MQDPYAEPVEYTQDDQQITVTHEGLWLETGLNFAGSECTVEGNFMDEAYDYLSFYF